MEILVNGKKREYIKTSNLSEFLIDYLQGKDTKGIALAKNGTIVPRNIWEHTLIEENDEIEIVHAVQGG